MSSDELSASWRQFWALNQFRTALTACFLNLSNKNVFLKGLDANPPMQHLQLTALRYDIGHWKTTMSLLCMITDCAGEFCLCKKPISKLHEKKNGHSVCMCVGMNHELPQADRTFTLILREPPLNCCAQSAALKELCCLPLFSVFGLKAISTDSHSSAPAPFQCLSLCRLFVWLNSLAHSLSHSLAHSLTQYSYSVCTLLTTLKS